MRSIEPYLIFNGNCNEAFAFYESVFGVKNTFLFKFKDAPADIIKDFPKADMERIMHILLPINEHISLMGSDSPSSMKVAHGEQTSLSLNVESKAEAEHIFKKLSEGGEVIMSLEKTFWAELYAMFIDKYGIHWMINYTTEKK